MYRNPRASCIAFRYATKPDSPSPFGYGSVVLRLSNPAPDSSLCRAAVPLLHPLQLLLPNCIKLLFPVSVHFSCCSPIASLQLLLATCVRFSCSSLISTACIRFDCCSPIAYLLVASPFLEDQPMPNVLG